MRGHAAILVIALVAAAAGAARAETSLPVIGARGNDTATVMSSPRVSAGDALLRARGVSGPPASERADRHARLAVLVHPAAPAPRLVWEVRHGDELARASYRTLVDAQTGEVLFRENLVARAARHRARVFDVNPIADDGERVEVVFADIDESSDRLVDDEIMVVGCVDTRSCREVKTFAGTRNIHYCETIPTAFADGDRGFLDIEVGDDTAPQDAFAEVQGYYHVKKALEAFRGFAGDPGFKLANPLTTVVNHRVPDLTSTISRCDGVAAKAGSVLAPEDNAYFWPGGDIGPTDLGDRILLSQGELADWAYDGEVVYHEVTHAVMHTTTPLAWYRHDELGIDFSPGGLHEGFSDYFASAMTGAAKTNLYAGMTEDGPEPLGDLEKTRRCTDSLVGEEHDESLAWSNALWMIRRSLRSAAKRAEFDAAMFRVISRLERFDGFAEASALVMAELESGSAALKEIAPSARQKLEDRELFGCNNRTLVVRPGDIKAELYAKGPNHYGIDMFADQAMPAGMQLSVIVAEDATGLRLTAESSFELVTEIRAANMKRAPRLSILIKPGDEPIRWQWQLPRGESDATMEVELERLDPDDDFSPFVATVMGDFPAGAYQVQVVNRGADWGLEELHVAVADASGEFDDDKADDVAGGGQGCASAPASGSDVAVLFGLLVFVAGAWRRRLAGALETSR